MDPSGERSSTRPSTFVGPSPWARAVLRAGIGLYLVLMGGLLGTLVERIRFDQRREAVMARYDAVLEARNARVMEIERAIALRFAPAGDHLAPVPREMQAVARDYGPERDERRR